MTSYKAKKDLATFLLYVFGFVLLWEWVRPLDKLTDTGNIGVFLGFLCLAMLLSFLGVRIWLGTLINSFYILVVLQNLYFSGPLFLFSWVPPFVKELLANIQMILAGNGQDLTNMFRSLLFFSLLSIMVYLLRYWLIYRRQLFIYFVMTVVYITILDTFTTYQGDGAIVRILLVGFAIMGILTFYRLIEKEGLKKAGSLTQKWMVALTVFIALSVAIGFAAPKLDPIWPDPVPFLKSFSQESGGGDSRKAGYGPDDSQLGGPLLGDNQTVFIAEVESRHYWKVEAKDVYTGKGWVVSEKEVALQPFSQLEPPPVSSFSKGVERISETAIVHFEEGTEHIAYPIGVQGIVTDPNINFGFNPVTEKIYPIAGENIVAVNQYALKYDVPKFSVTALMAAEVSGNDPNLGEDHFMPRYTQLPSSLPARVARLAQEITSDKRTMFEQVRAIEDYFDSEEFIYDKVNALVPGKNDDYVDQFLFESKRGYCNNYSTSMVVMLRTLGIPSRWVKGYTEGENKGFGSDNHRTFEITNNNAHSWVEVYFANVGWVPFEPTKSFTSLVQFNYDTYKQEQPDMETEQIEPELKEESQPDAKEQAPVKKKQEFWLANLWTAIKTFFNNGVKVILLMMVIFTSGGIVLYQTRAKWLPNFYIWKFYRRTEDKFFAEAYMELLKQLERQGLKRKAGQTLRDYAKAVDRYLPENEMSRLTARYEEYLYKGFLQEGSWKELRDLWKKLIKMTIA